jgi:mono/diheme cytochrome c family protein
LVVVGSLNLGNQLMAIQKPAVTALSSAAASILCVATFSCGDLSAAEIDFAAQIRPIFNKHCVACHGGVKRAGGISFLSRDSALAKADSGEAPIVPGKPSESALVQRITSTDEAIRMPPADHGPALTPKQIQQLTTWVEEGAPWEVHWAYKRPVTAKLPQVVNNGWSRQDLDRFILHRLEQAGLEPSPEADRRVWLRRVSFDLTGLPPTLEEVHAFLSDDSPQAYEKVVDRLLTSNAYGERWASVWLDLARYADTVGYERDPTRAIWPWRDWIVQAYNADMPYDEFLIKQLAGDLLPGATLDDKLATAFHRNTQTNTECGTDDEEFRNVALMDRINTTWEGLMSTSFRCVQCHSHPYDPFAHEEFYRLLAIFNSTQDNDSAEDFPHLSVPVKLSDRATAQKLDSEYQSLRNGLHAEGTALAERTKWKPLKASKAESTGLTTMTIQEVDGIPEITATGNVRLQGVFTLEFPVATKQFASLRLEALPFDAERSATASELGFVLSHLKVELVSSDPATTTEVPLVAVYDEDPSAFYPAEATFNDDLPGWSAYPRFHRPRRAVFSVAEPVSVPEGAVLRLTMKQLAQSTGITAQVIRRARYAMSDESSWTDLVRSQSEQRKRIDDLAAQRKAIASVAVPIIREQHSSQQRDSRLYVRGNFLSPGELMQPAVPAVLGAVPVSNRLEFARWMTRPEHPLTARSAVNRLWEQLFGRGLAEIVEDFGSVSPAPTHPELLDWLAVRFSSTHAWSQKKLLREIVLSATYRQNATVSQHLKERDPQNRLYSRGPRTRLSAEMVRDQALAVSGSLSGKMGGPPVMPLQPDGIWKTVYNASKWETSPGDDAHRRSLYTFIRRTSGYPSYQIFDAPTREVCAVRRITTNTPLQALVTLNDPVYIEAATQLASRMLQSGMSREDQLRFGYELVTGQPIRSEAIPILTRLFETSRAKVESDEAAMTIVANALLNLDATLTH